MPTHDDGPHTSAAAKSTGERLRPERVPGAALRRPRGSGHVAGCIRASHLVARARTPTTAHGARLVVRQLAVVGRWLVPADRAARLLVSSARAVVRRVFPR